MPVTTSLAPKEVDPRALTTELDQALAILFLSKASGEGNWLSAAEISRVLQEKYGISFHWRTVQAVLGQNEEGLVARKKKGGTWHYSIMHFGEQRLAALGPSIVVIDPANAVQAVSTLHASLSTLRGQIQVCDPYIDGATIEHLSVCPKGAIVWLLTKKIQDELKVKRLHSAAATQGVSIGVRVASSAALHDRFIIDDNSTLILGTSLNGFGKKLCFVVRAGEDIRRSMLAFFDSAWNRATPWP